MDNDELIIKIAKHMGLMDIRYLSGELVHGPEYRPESVPDYPNDLNAMHEAEKTLTNAQYRLFAGQLTGMDRPLESYRFISATAQQRAQAFVGVIG